MAILAKTHGGVGGGSVVAVDMLADRLKVAERYGWHTCRSFAAVKVCKATKWRCKNCDHLCCFGGIVCVLAGLVKSSRLVLLSS